MESFCQCLGVADQEQLLHPLPSLVRPLPAPTADRRQIIREGGGCVQGLVCRIPSVHLCILFSACLQQDFTTDWHGLLGLHRLLGWSYPPTPNHPHPHPHPPSQPAGGDAALLQITQIQTRFICSASDLIGHRALKKVCYVFSFLCMFPHSSSWATSDVRVCVSVCV